MTPLLGRCRRSARLRNALLVLPLLLAACAGTSDPTDSSVSEAGQSFLTSGDANGELDPSAGEASPTTTPSSPPLSETTSPVGGSGRSTPLLALGDIGLCDSDEPARVARVAEQLPGKIVAAGDIAYPSGTLEELQQCFGVPFADVLDRVIPVTGNHEYRTKGAAGWKEFFGRSDTYYAEQVGDWRVIVLDSECDLIGGCEAEDPQQRWFAEQLASAPLCVAVAMHRPYRTSYAKYDNESRSAVIYEMAVDADVEVVLNGHAHHYERSRSGNTRQFIVGTGGAGLRDVGPPFPDSEEIVLAHGLLALDLAADSFSWRFIDTANSVRDSGSASCA